jgi:hypothetical protein
MNPWKLALGAGAACAACCAAPIISAAAALGLGLPGCSQGGLPPSLLTCRPGFHSRQADLHSLPLSAYLPGVAGRQ